MYKACCRTCSFFTVFFLDFNSFHSFNSTSFLSCYFSFLQFLLWNDYDGRNWSGRRGYLDIHKYRVCFPSLYIHENNNGYFRSRSCSLFFLGFWQMSSQVMENSNWWNKISCRGCSYRLSSWTDLFPVPIWIYREENRRQTKKSAKWHKWVKWANPKPRRYM